MAANCYHRPGKAPASLWAERPEAPFFREGLRNERVFWSSRLWRFVIGQALAGPHGWQGLKPNYFSHLRPD